MSHDVRGFNSPQKRKKAFNAYKRMQAGIIFLQETHFSRKKNTLHTLIDLSVQGILPHLGLGPEE